MKKVIAICLFVLLAIPVQAQWWGKGIKGNGNMTTITRTVGEYDQVKVAGSFDVRLVTGTEGTLTVEGEGNLLEYLITEVKDGALKIRIQKGKSIRPSNRMEIKVTVPFKDIDAVTLSGSGDVWNEDVIKADNFKTSIAGSGDLKLEVEANTIDANLAGSGDLSLIGSARTLEASLAGSGDIHAKNMKADHADARVAGSGDIAVYSSKSIKARVSGSGDIDCYGNPDKQDTKVVGSGDISVN